MTLLKEFTKGLWKEIPPFRLALGLCPILAVTKTTENGLGMGLAVIFVLVFSNLLISSLRRVVPKEVRIAAFICIIATFVVITELVMQAYFYPLYDKLGIFIPLIVVNCIPFGRAEAFAYRNPVLPSLADGLGMGLGFTVSLVAVGSIREILGYGTWFGLHLFGPAFQPFSFMAEAPGAFICLGVMLGAIDYLDRKK